MHADCLLSMHQRKNQDEEKKLPTVDETYVTFKLHSEVKLTGQNGTQLPSEVTNFIDNQESLATFNLDLKNANQYGYLRLSNIFADMKEYQEWRSSNETEKFIQYLQQNTDRQMEMRISMIRTPLNELIKYTDLN